MPIKPELRSRHYGRNWRLLSKRLIERRAGNSCEWCHARNYQPHPVTGSKVVLTVAHFNHIAGDDRPENLIVLCQRCHLSLDRDQHVENARATRQEKKDDARPLFAMAKGEKNLNPWSRQRPVSRPRDKKERHEEIDTLGPLFSN